jgi:hypothetical protein
MKVTFLLFKDLFYFLKDGLKVKPSQTIIFSFHNQVKRCKLLDFKKDEHDGINAKYVLIKCK